MSLSDVREKLDFLVEKLVSPIEQRLMLRSTLEESLRKLGCDEQEITMALDEYYRRGRTLH